MKKILTNKRGEGHLDTGVKIIIAVVIGSLILGGIYLLFAGRNGIFEQLDHEIEYMVNTGEDIQLENQSGELMYSYDGDKWESAQIKGVEDASKLKQVTSITENEQKVWLTVYKNSNGDKVYSSLDGINWTPIFSGEELSIMTYSDSVAVINSNGMRYESDDGIDWRMTSTKDY